MPDRSAAAPGNPSASTRQNRFARHPKITVAATVLVLLGLIEGVSYLVLIAKGHRDLRFQYRYNRILSGYTVFQNVPNHSFRTSAIKSSADEPDPVLDEHGFLCDVRVSPEKRPGTFRIFLVGGSTAFGAGQNVRYHGVHSYPDGLYSYPASIAGRLKAWLTSQKPGMRFEVINAAGFERRIHQTLLQYLETLSRFHPDLIVNLEGMNDVYSVTSGQPYADVAEQLPFYVNLYRRPYSPLNYSATYYVLATALEKWSNRPRWGGKAQGSAETNPAENTERPQGKSSAALSEADRRHYEQNAQRLLQIVRQYFAVLKADNTRAIFALQPLLHRRKVNKRLTPIERQLAAVLVPTQAGRETPIDTTALVLMEFYDDYLSPALAREAAVAGVKYIDLNAAIASLGPDIEFYTDYCHLTPQGNQRVAEILGAAIVEGRFLLPSASELPKSTSRAPVKR